LKWALPGDFTGGLMMFGIMFTIAIIEMYVLKAYQSFGNPEAIKGTIGTGVGALGSGGGSDVCSFPFLSKEQKKKCYEIQGRALGTRKRLEKQGGTFKQ